MKFLAQLKIQKNNAGVSTGNGLHPKVKVSVPSSLLMANYGTVTSTDKKVMMPSALHKKHYGMAAMACPQT